MKNLSALVTGASEGLGKAFALELAARNADLVLVALPGSRLPELAEYIRNNFSVRVYHFEMDLTSMENMTGLFDSLNRKNIKVNILINNAGLGNMSWFQEKSIMFYKKQIELNVLSPVVMTRLFLDQLSPSGESFILNVGSLGAVFHVPRKQVYGATKSFIRYFTKSLQTELAHRNVHISLLNAGGINTSPELLVYNHSLKGISRASICEAEEVACIALNGLFSKKREIVPGRINKLAVLLNNFLPDAVRQAIIRRRLQITTVS